MKFYHITKDSNTIHNTAIIQPITYHEIVNKFGISITAGHKWISTYGIYLEPLIGVGTYLSSNATLYNPEVDYYLNDLYHLESYGYYYDWNFRIQLSIGYKFGG